jgi:hypothetical protein
MFSSVCLLMHPGTYKVKRSHSTLRCLNWWSLEICKSPVTPLLYYMFMALLLFVLHTIPAGQLQHCPAEFFFNLEKVCLEVQKFDILKN